MRPGGGTRQQVRLRGPSRKSLSLSPQNEAAGGGKGSEPGEGVLGVIRLSEETPDAGAQRRK